MTKPLLTRLGRVISFFCFFILLTHITNAQVALSIEECGCLPDEEFFTQRLIIDADPGDEVVLVSTTNFYTSITPVPINFTSNVVLDEFPLSSGMFPIDSPANPDGFRRGGYNTSVLVRVNGNLFDFSTSSICRYTEIEGDSYLCTNSGGIPYTLNTDVIGPVSWTITPALPVDGSSVPFSVNGRLIDWGSTTGTYVLTAQGTSDSGCDFEIDYDITVASGLNATQIACNNSVQISLNGQCELQVDADMIIEGNDLLSNDAYDILLIDIETGEILSNNMVTHDYLDRPIQVTVIQNCSGNSCWGTIVVEDKSAPALMCPNDVTLECDESADPQISGLPLPMGTDVIETSPGNYLLPDFDFCGDATLTYLDEFADHTLCDGPFGSIFNRVWIITDDKGNTSSCSQKISVERADLTSTIEWPPHFDDLKPGGNPSLEACDNFPTLDSGYPSPDFTGYPEGVFCANVTVEYVDIELPGCSEVTYKLIRKWKIKDICSEELPLEFEQFIVVDDTQPPVFITMPDDMTVSAASHTCISDIIVPSPLFVEECGEWFYEVGYKLADDSGDPFTDFVTDGIRYDFGLGQYIIEDIPIANEMVWIIYILSDHCGNTSTGNIEITVEDHEEPVPVCDLNTFVGLNEYGEAHAGVESFDDGSWDNCSIHHLEVIRMDGAPCGGPLGWGQKVHFCCEDVGQDIRVRLRVWDTAGNSNECMVIVQVQDNIPPLLVSCPPSRTIDCDSDLTNLTLFGFPVFTDECGVTITELDPVIDNEECNSGTTVLRRFVATDDAGNESNCSQLLNLEILDPFDINDIDWPNDIDNFDGCVGADADPDNLPAGSDYPVLSNVACSEVLSTYDDVVFDYVDGVCKKILRKWKVWDECTNEKWEYTQTIRVVNNYAPEFFAGCDNYSISNLDQQDCTAEFSIVVQAFDDCTASDDLKWRYVVDNSPTLVGDENFFEGVFGTGTHRIVWTVEDQCGNTNTCTTVFTISDTKAPTPICRDAIVTVINEDGGTVEIWATDFIKEGTDNCTDPEDLIYSFSENNFVPNLEFNCDDLNGGTVDTLELTIYVTDEAGNTEFCTSDLILQDNNNVCENATSQRIDIKGNVYTEEDIMVDGVEVRLNNSSSETPLFNLTDVDGSYAFTELDMYNSYGISPARNDNPLNGVSTLDLVLIQKHILGLQKLDTPYKIIAADANNSESVTAIDLVELRKLILGLYDVLPGNQSWRFVDKSFEFTDPQIPFPFVEQIDYAQVDADMTGSDFVAIKIGDVNFSAQANNDHIIENRSREYRSITIDDQSFHTEDLIEIPVYLEEAMSIEGMQMMLDIDSESLVIQSIKAGKLNINDGHYNVLDGQVAISWNTNSKVTIGEYEVLFTIVAQALTSSNLAGKVYLSDDKLTPEMYSVSSDEIQTYSTQLRVTNEGNDIFSLHQNIPNPFSQKTRVSFVLPEAGAATLSIMDYTGKVLHVVRGTYTQGYNEVSLSTQNIAASGILYYTLETKSHTATNKMILLK